MTAIWDTAADRACSRSSTSWWGLVASDYDYFKGVNKIEEVAEAALAVVLWPLVLLDVSMRF